MSKDRKEYFKKYYQAHREANKARVKAYSKAYYQEHKDKIKERCKAYRQVHKEHYREYHKDYWKDYWKSDVNANGQTKTSIRSKSQRYLNKYGKKIEGYQIHHCCSYSEPYKFIYCSREMHKLIHSYLRQHNIDADSEHYAQIKHLLDDTVVKYNLE